MTARTTETLCETHERRWVPQLVCYLHRRPPFLVGQDESLFGSTDEESCRLQGGQ